ncbi:MAG: TetR/AcrR family transcriptional regulator [Candidatus Marsarchaeota archaeon]|nr:TetR/AcrR family transcriptional regulator [Candidatus Marsarchaeota archaeon]
MTSREGTGTRMHGTEATLSKPETADTRKAGRPRDPEIADAILLATLELLAENGYRGTSLDAVAERAGVGKPTVYRRWPSKQDLVVAALERYADIEAAPYSGNARERVAQFMEEWWLLAVHPDKTTVTRVLASILSDVQRYPELREAIHRGLLSSRHTQMHRLLQSGIDSGELQPDLDVDLVVDLLFSPLLVRRLVSGGPMSPNAARKIVDIIFDGCCAPDSNVTPHSTL